MPDEGGAVAVAEAPVNAGQAEVTSSQSIGGSSERPAPGPQDERIDGRQQPDQLRKHIAELRRRADTLTDPVEKKAELDRIKYLFDTSGKTKGYEEQFPKVKDAREAKALIDSFGGREGLTQIQQTLSSVQQIDEQLEAGDPTVSKRMWDEAPAGMTKLAPVIFAELETRNPQEYQKAIVPHAVKFFDQSGFPEAFDQMTELVRGGKKDEALALAGRLAQWFASQRQAGAQRQEQRVDPNVERLQRELDERKTRESAEATDRGYRSVVQHAGPVIDKYLRPIVAKLGLSKDQYEALREDTWKHLQDTRNDDATYKTVATSKYRQGMDEAVKYIQGETESRAQDAARSRANFWYGHQLKNGAVRTPNATAAPTAPGVTRGKEPSPSEIDYSIKGIQVAKKQGFRDLADMILAGKAPLKAGGIRQWR